MTTDPLGTTLFALSDPTRRAILARLASGDATVKALAAPYEMSQAAVSKHLKVLETAGLISRRKEAQSRPCRLEAAPLRGVADWVEEYPTLLGSELRDPQGLRQNASAAGGTVEERQARSPKTEDDPMSIDIDTTSTVDPVITMVYTLDAPREVVWEVFTDPKHVTRWYGGKGFANPVCEMDVRPGGHWRHVMRTPDGGEHRLQFIFVDVVKPERLSWKTEHGLSGEPAAFNTLTLEDHGDQTRVLFVARFASIVERDLAMNWGFATVLGEGVERMRAVLATLRCMN